MFNSFGFNTEKFNSVLVIEQVEEQVVNVYRVKGRRRLKTQDFILRGKKLLSYTQYIKLFGLLLLFNECELSIEATKLYQIQSTLKVLGKKLFSFEDIIELQGLVKYLIKNEIDVIAFKKFLKKQVEEVKGQKLLFDSFKKEIYGVKEIFISEKQEIKGKVSVLKKQEELIVGKKDIIHILEVLDIFDFGEE